MLLCYGQEIAFGCRTGTADSRTNASALGGDLLIGGTGATHLKFIRAIAGKDEVGMGIHEAGRHHSAIARRNTNAPLMSGAFVLKALKRSIRP